jgi:hypothetical protein
MLRKSLTGLLVCAALLPAPACRTATGTGAVGGAVGGAILGAAIDSHHRGRGALIGAAAGALVGTAVGAAVDAEERADREREAARSRRVIVREYYEPATGETTVYRYEPVPPPAPQAPTQVTTTVTRWNPNTGQWETVEQTTTTVQ